MEISKQEFENQQELNEEALDQASGGKRAQYMDIYCSTCAQHFTADVTKDKVYCSYCGTPIRLFG